MLAWPFMLACSWDVINADSDTDTHADPSGELCKKAGLSGRASEEDTAFMSLQTTEPRAMGIPAGHGVQFQEPPTELGPDIPQNSGTVQHSRVIKACSDQFGCIILPSRLKHMPVVGCFGHWSVVQRACTCFFIHSHCYSFVHVLLRMFVRPLI